MCILITEDSKKKEFMDQAKRAGLKDDQLVPIADLLWTMEGTESMAYRTSILVRR